MTNSLTVDDILCGITTPRQENSIPKPEEAQEVSDGLQETPDKSESEVSETKREETTQESEKSSVAEEKELTDEYGNNVEKPKMYSEEDVQRMIRERLARGRQDQTSQQNTQVQQAAKGFEVDPNSTDAWEVQLENFIEKTIDKVQTKAKTQAWQAHEQQKQADFEAKFTTTMNKYRDFKETVAQVPITDSMLMATRSMNDPAAFVYAASKNHPDELKRISSLGDPYQQAAEIGKLEERMKKARNLSKAPPPLSSTKGDMPTSYVPKKSIDQLIQSHAKGKVR